jgi:hypothetical protein
VTLSREGRLLFAGRALPFYLAGGLKIVYDLALYFRFRRLALPADEAAAP